MEEVTANSIEGGDAYIFARALFCSIRNCGLSGGWELYSSQTNVDEQIFSTTYTNGKVFVKAHSANNIHTYIYGEMPKEE